MSTTSGMGVMWRTDRVVRNGMIATAFLLLIQWGVFGVFIWRLPPEIPLFYSLPLGAAQLAQREWIFILPLSSTLFTGLNWLLMRLIPTSMPIYPEFLSWLNTLYSFLAFIAMIHITLIIL